MISWENFVVALQTRFNSSQFVDPLSMLVNLRPQGTVEDYKSKFEDAVNRVRGLSEAYKMSFFLNGLSEEIKHDVKMLYPQNVNTA